MLSSSCTMSGRFSTSLTFDRSALQEKASRLFAPTSGSVSFDEIGEVNNQDSKWSDDTHTHTTQLFNFFIFTM